MRALSARLVLFVLRSSRGVWCAVASAAVVFGLFEFAVSRWFIGGRLDPNLHAALQASIVGLGAGCALWIVLLGVMERRRIIADELRRVAELNHSVRNFLELIVLSHYADADKERKAMMLECTARIDQKLRELFPVPTASARNGESGEGVSKRKSPGKGRATGTRSKIG